jgi:ABC-type bacteriocin/lantibiotic exporter with double-glycine peptidase domain
MRSNLLSKIFTLLDYKQKFQVFILIFFMLLASLSELFGLGLVILIINSFLGINNEINFSFLKNLSFIKNSSDYINYILVLFLIVFTLKFIILIYVSWLEANFLTKFRESISYKLYNSFLNRDSLSIWKKNSAEYLRNFSEDINLGVLFYTSLIRVLLDSIIFIGFFIFLVIYQPIISLTTITFFSLIVIIYYFSIKNIILNAARQGLLNRKKKIQFINESFSSIKYIKILSSENFFLRKFKLQNSLLSKTLLKTTFLALVPKHTLEYILFLSIILLLFFLVKNEFQKEEIFQMLSIYSLSAFRVVPVLARVLSNVQNIRFTYSSFEKIFIENNYPVSTKERIVKKFFFNKEIKIKIDKFIYDNKKNFFLENISINIAKNSKIGIVGQSGSGKSTLVDIICGFRGLKDKNILVDGKSILSNLAGWHKIIGYIPQNIVLLNQSLRENILFGSNKKYFPDKEIKKILTKVDLDSFLKKLPKGLSQIISEDGHNISGGEKQRIGIARALLNDPEIIILDEATSSLDTFTENKILSSIKNLKKTIIIISHRVNTLNFCDKVYSINDNTLKRIIIN